MKVQITFSLNVEDRYAIAAFVGGDKPATYDDCRDHITALVSGDLETLTADRTEAIRFQKEVERDEQVMRGGL